MKEPIFTGSGVAIVTPFRNETVDFPALGRLLEVQIAAGTDAIIVCGTTGEASTMTYHERMRTIEYCVDQVMAVFRSSPAAGPIPQRWPST